MSANTEMKITVLLADDHRVVREGLRAILETADDMEVVAEVDNGRQAVQYANRLHPDVAVLDVLMPELNGLGAARHITMEVPDCKVLILSAYNDPDLREQFAEAGVAAYLTKQAAADELLETIRQIHNGRRFFTRAINGVCHDRGHAPGRLSSKRTPLLTLRETEVLQLIAEGETNKQIAHKLGISIKTIEKHRQSVMDKLRIHDIAGLTRYAISRRIIPPPLLASA